MDKINLLGAALLSAGIAFSILVLARFAIHKMFNYKTLHEIENEGNIAIAIRHGAIYIAVAMAMIGSLNSPLAQLIDGITALVFVLISSIIADKIIFANIDNSEKIQQGNLALALAEAGLFIGTGNIALASFSGTGPFLSSIVFFALGQAVLVLAALAAEEVYRGIKYMAVAENVSAGILFGSVILSISFIVKSSVYGDFNGWTQDITSFFVYAAVGFILMFVFANKLIDWIFLPNSKIIDQIRKDNKAAIIIVAGVKISIALIISGVIM